MKDKITSFLFNFCKKSLILLLIFGAFFYIRNDARSESLEFDKIRRADEILVKYKNSEKLYSVKINSSQNLDEIIAEYSKKPEVEYAEPNYLYQASIIPSDTYYGDQWYLKKIKAAQAWDEVRESSEIVIAIIDTGVQIGHPDLMGNIWQNKKEIPDNNIDDDKNGFMDDVNGWDFVNNVNNPEPKFQEGFTQDGVLHGTIVAGIAAASGNNATGISGVSWNAKIMALKVLDDKGEGDTRNVIRAVDYAIANGADIINFSFVGVGYSSSLELAIKRAYDKGIIIVAAAGNEENGHGYFLDNTPMYPVCHDGSQNMVIGVAATNDLDEKADFSGYGSKCIDISAPGVKIFSTSVYSSYHQIDNNPFSNYYDGYWSGTSMAVPMVSGTVALIEAANPSLDKFQVRAALLDSSENINRLNPGYSGLLGAGRLNAYGAVLSAKNILQSKTSRLVVAPQENYMPLVKIVDRSGNMDRQFLAYDKSFQGGVNVAVGDIDGDRSEEIITGTGFTGGPQVRIFNSKGELEGQFFAYDKNFRGGVNVAVGDIDGDGVDEIIAGAGFTGGPHIRIFNNKGELKGQFFAYDKNFRGGVNVAVGDIDGDGVDEIIAGAGATGGPQVRVFNKKGELKSQFFAYDKNFRGGVNVAVADIDGGARNNKMEIITSPGKGGGPHIKIFDNYSRVLGQFFAYDEKFKGGVKAAAIDSDNDGLEEVITGAGPGGAPHVRVFKDSGILLGSFYALEEKFSGGVNVSSIIY